MTDKQMRRIREDELDVVKTILTGDIHVRRAGEDLLLNPSGEYEPFDLQRGRRVTPAEAPPAT